MCPDRQILSVYFDGELDSPWKEKLEKHLEDCPSCKEYLASYRFTRKKLNEGSLDPEPFLEQAMDRVWEKTNYTAKPKHRFWTGSITIPVPAAAAAGIVMALAIAALIALKQPAKINDPHLAGLAGLEMQEMIPVSADMNSFFQYLGDDNSTDMVIIRLPNTTFQSAGEPRMLRAADYSGSGGSR